MIRKIARFFRFAMKAERLLLAYQAWGCTEEEVIVRWTKDLDALARGKTFGERAVSVVVERES